jgi:hypothetical protein
MNKMSKKTRPYREKISQESEDQVLAEFYRSKRPDEDIVDNRDKTIAKIVGLSEITVAAILQRETARVYAWLDKRVANQ